jgi:hypothetical protein
MAFKYYKLEREESGADIHDSDSYDVGYFKSDVPDEKAFGGLYKEYLRTDYMNRSNSNFVKYVESKGYKIKELPMKTARIFW